MNVSQIFRLCSLLLFCLSTLANPRLEKMNYAVQKGELQQVDELLRQNDYTYAEYDFLISQAEGIAQESKSWWFAIWLMMILGAIVAFRATLEALKLARKAPKYDNATTLFALGFIIAVGLAGVYIGIKGFNKYRLYSKVPEIALRLEAAKKSKLATLS